MAHKTLIGGTAYEISGGKTLVSGTAYSIDMGKTLVGGTTYEVGFAEPVTITLKRSQYYGGDVVHAWIVVNGQTYYAEETPSEISVKAGTTITCCATTGVQVNGQYVSYGNYEYTVSSNAIIEITNAHNSDTQYIGLIQITEQ